MNLLNDERLIKAIQNSEEAAIGEVIAKYSRLLWSIAHTILKNAASEQDIEECVADVFIYLWQHPEKYDARRGGLKAWLSLLARSQAIDRYRALSRHSTLPLDDAVFVEQLDLADELLAEDARRALDAAVRALDEPEREILLRRYCYGQKPKEIAFALDMPVKRVENCLYRAKRRLRDRLTEEKEAFE